MTEESNAVVQAPPTSLSATAKALEELGVSSQDLIIPKLLLMQNTSEYVGDGKAKLGDIVNSQTIDVIGGLDKAVLLVPLKLYKTWRVYDMSSGQPEFKRQDAVSASNEKLPWEGVEDGKPIRRDLCMNFFVLLGSELADGTAFPCVVSFKRTSIQAGRQLATHLFKRACLGQLPYSQAIPLQVKKEKKDTNTYAVFEMGKASALSAEFIQAAKDWTERLVQITYKVDDTDEEVAAAAAAPAAAPVVVGGAPDMSF